MSRWMQPQTQLTCGADSVEIRSYASPPQPPFLPIPTKDTPNSPPSRKRKQTTGCGVIVHYGAIVSPGQMWRAAETRWPSVTPIVPLEDRYFPAETRDALDLGRKRCGCTRTGIGCTYCGNTLGALSTPCPAHQKSRSGKNYYTILPSAVSPPISPYVPPVPVPQFAPPSPPPMSSSPPPQPEVAAVVEPHLESEPAVVPVTESPVLPHPRARARHPTSPSPPPVFYADFTPTPSPEIHPAYIDPFSIHFSQQSQPETLTETEMWTPMDETVTIVEDEQENGHENGEQQPEGEEARQTTDAEIENIAREDWNAIEAELRERDEGRQAQDAEMEDLARDDWNAIEAELGDREEGAQAQDAEMENMAREVWNAVPPWLRGSQRPDTEAIVRAVAQGRDIFQQALAEVNAMPRGDQRAGGEGRQVTGTEPIVETVADVEEEQHEDQGEEARQARLAEIDSRISPRAREIFNRAYLRVFGVPVGELEEGEGGEEGR
ncbi:hypothetical protein FB45DRAFT_919905 [Roridomyces roridus]|uniref:Uncharacterized protein n=1 Tax=Roridomyces roridus TaxID=1738132 RepID=A0AAD7FKB4_9AGAR|nr:hypothetical protein FB45DRAFT_919905 [Roridomyces roridus]